MSFKKFCENKILAIISLFTVWERLIGTSQETFEHKFVKKILTHHFKHVLCAEKNRLT